VCQLELSNLQKCISEDFYASMSIDKTIGKLGHRGATETEHDEAVCKKMPQRRGLRKYVFQDTVQ
jgi:hypothetical protein